MSGAGPAAPGAGELAAVLFDMDGLLVASEELWYATECEVAARLGSDVWTREHKAALVGGSLQRTAAYMLEVLAPVVPSPAPSREEVEGWLLEGMERRLRQAPVPWMPGARDLVVAVRREGVPTALVSASYRVIIEAALASAGETLFDTTVAGDEVARTKPDPMPYREAARRLGVDPSACVVLEDSESGSRAGLAAGCVTVVVPFAAPVPELPGLHRRASLTDLDVVELRRIVAQSRPAP